MDREKEMNSERYVQAAENKDLLHEKMLLEMSFIVCLISFSHNLHAQTVRGNTALHYSCLHNKTECLKLLLKAKANTHISEKIFLPPCVLSLTSYFIMYLFNNK